MSEDPIFHARTKHINKYHYNRSLVQDGVVKLQYISIDEQVVNALMKLFPKGKDEYFWDKLGLVDISSLDWEG